MSSDRLKVEAALEHAETCAPHLTFGSFSSANATRSALDFKQCPEFTKDAILSFTLGVGEEAGEVLGKVRALLGITQRKAGTTKADVLMEIGDVGAYLDLLAQSLGASLGEAMTAKFNLVSERIGSSIVID